MWTAQTYLGAHVAAAKYFIYLLFEDYVPEQRDFQEAVVENLRELGMRTGNDSAIFVPDSCAKEFIRMEFSDIFRREMMEKIFKKTPGLLFTDKNLKDLNPAKDRWAYISLQPYAEGRAHEKLPRLFERMEKTIKGSDDLLKEISGSKWRSIWEAMKDVIVLEPNFSGLGVDVKAIRARFVLTENVE